MKQDQKLLRSLIIIISSVVIISSIVIIFSIRSTVYWEGQHDEAVVLTKKTINTHTDSLINEIQSLNRVQLGIQQTVDDIIRENQNMKKSFEKQLQIKNNIIRKLTLDYEHLVDSLQSLERSELEQRYRDK